MQLQLGSEVRLVGLTQAEARKTMGVLPFAEGITIARAYDLHRLKYCVSSPLAFRFELIVTLAIRLLVNGCPQSTSVRSSPDTRATWMSSGNTSPTTPLFMAMSSSATRPIRSAMR